MPQMILFYVEDIIRFCCHYGEKFIGVIFYVNMKNLSWFRKVLKLFTSPSLSLALFLPPSLCLSICLSIYFQSLVFSVCTEAVKGCVDIKN